MKGIFLKGVGLHLFAVFAATLAIGAISRETTMLGMFGALGMGDLLTILLTSVQAGMIAAFMPRHKALRALAVGLGAGIVLTASLPVALSAADPDVTFGQMMKAASAETCLRSILLTIQTAVFFAGISHVLQTVRRRKRLSSKTA